MACALITGGTGGIGTALTRCFVDNGYHVLCTHNNKSESLLSQWLTDNNLATQKVTFISLDINEVAETMHKLETLLLEFQVDVLVNNAGVTNDATFLNMSFNQWNDVIRTNLVGLFGVTQVIARQMALRGAGNIVNISSINGLKGQFGQTNYSASKAGILGFTKALALELAGKGVRVNAICPGYTATSMVLDMPKQVLDDIERQIPTGRLVSPQEIAATAMFLVQSMASMTGETISVNGGHYMS